VHCFTTTGDPDQFREIGQRFLGPEIGTVSHTLPAVSPESMKAEYV